MKSIQLTHIIWGLVWLSVVGCQSSSQSHQVTGDVVVLTEKGEIVIDLWDETPIHRDNFLKLARSGFFDSLAFHRVIDGFMIQAGDPRTRTAYPPTDTAAPDGPGYDLAGEFGPYSVHVPGSLAAARLGDDRNPERRSAGSQFYFVASGDPISNRVLDSMEQVYTSTLRGLEYQQYQAAQADSSFTGTFDQYLTQQDFQSWQYPSELRQQYRQQGGAPWLDFTYTVFGRVITGMEVINAINLTATDPYDRPLQPIRILSVSILSDPPS